MRVFEYYDKKKLHEGDVEFFPYHGLIVYGGEPIEGLDLNRYKYTDMIDESAPMQLGDSIERKMENIWVRDSLSGKVPYKKLGILFTGYDWTEIRPLHFLSLMEMMSECFYNIGITTSLTFDEFMKQVGILCINAKGKEEIYAQNVLTEEDQGIFGMVGKMIFAEMFDMPVHLMTEFASDKPKMYTLLPDVEEK